MNEMILQRVTGQDLRKMLPVKCKFNTGILNLLASKTYQKINIQAFSNYIS